MLKDFIWFFRYFCFPVTSPFYEPLHYTIEIGIVKREPVIPGPSTNVLKRY